MPSATAFATAASSPAASLRAGSPAMRKFSTRTLQKLPRRASPIARHAAPPSAGGTARIDGTATAGQPAAIATPCAAAIPTRVPL